jgi:fumarate hydratase subunit beta
MIKLSFPFTEEKIRALNVGGEVLISGVVFTGRDAAARPAGEKVHPISSNI